MEPLNYPFKKHSDTNKEIGGLIINDKDASNTKLIIEIIKNLSKKLIQLNVVDILKFSRPAKLTSPISVLACTGNEYALTSLLDKAYEVTDPIERMKYVTAFILSGYHQNPVLCRSKAPFNPIVGETYQAVQPNGAHLYLEQTAHHPPTLNFYLTGPNKNYELFGYGFIDAKLDGLNLIRGVRNGKNILKFKDGTHIIFSNMSTRINGVIIGDRTYNYYGKLSIKDYTHKIESLAEFYDEVNETIIDKIFSKKKIFQYDETKIEIKQVNPETKEKEVKSKGVASWLGQVVFDDKVYWDLFGEQDKWSQEGLWLCPSDSCYRTDLICVLQNDLEKAQIEKERLEELQRRDQKLRDAYKEKK